MPQRFKEQYSSVDENLRRERTKKYKTNYFFYIDDAYIDNCKKVYPHWNDADTPTTCAFMKEEGQNNIALIGSSHAAHLFYGLSEYYKNSENSIALFPMGSQSPFYNLKVNYEARSTWYSRIIDAYEYVLNHDNIKTVVLSDLNDYFSDVDNPKEKDLYMIIKNGARRSFEKLKGKNVLVILDNPWAPFDPSLCSVRPFSFGFKDSKCDYLYTESTNVTFAKQHQQAILEVAKEYPNVRVFDLKNLFCKGNNCTIKIKGCNVYSDVYHLTSEGSSYVAPFIAKEIENFQK